MDGTIPAIEAAADMEFIDRTGRISVAVIRGIGLADN